MDDGSRDASGGKTGRLWCGRSPAPERNEPKTSTGSGRDDGNSIREKSGNASCVVAGPEIGFIKVGMLSRSCLGVDVGAGSMDNCPTGKLLHESRSGYAC